MSNKPPKKAMRTNAGVSHAATEAVVSAQSII